MNTKQASEKFGIKESTVLKAAGEGRLRHEKDVNGNISIPDDEIKPLAKSQIQTILWMIFKAKNEPDSEPDPSKIEDIHCDQMGSVFKQLVFRKYIDGIESFESLGECCRRCRITERGIELLQEKVLPGVPLGRKIAEASLVTILQELIQILPRWAGVC